MKKLLIFAICLCTPVLFFLSGCAQNSPAGTDGTHTHAYTETVSAAGCVTEGKRTFTCSCGDSYTEAIDAAGHAWGDWSELTAPTPYEAGEKIRQCSACGEEQRSAIPKKTISVLFIGNSYTYTNDMPTDIFKQIALSQGMDIRVSSFTKGAHTLLKHASADDSVGALVDDALSENKYDYVVIQEQSHTPATAPANFYDGARALCTKIRANGATPILYSTWGRKDGSSELASWGFTHESMTYKLAAAYDAIGEELGIERAHVGLAFHEIAKTSATELYTSDKSHPSYAGSYLAAMTLYAEIFDIDPTAITYNGRLNASVAARLREAAGQAAAGQFTVPESYKTSSVGVTLKSAVDYSRMKNLTSLPTSEMISLITGGNYPSGKPFSGITGDKGAVASTEYSTTGLTAAQKADIADIGYGVSVIGVEKMDASSLGYKTAIANLVNGHWGGSMMSFMTFDDKKYDISGNASPDGKYTALITLNFSQKCRFDAIGFFSGNMEGFPGAAEVYVSDDGKSWTLVPTACWDCEYGAEIKNIGASPKDPYNSNTAPTSCFFGMESATGKYIRIGVVIGRTNNAPANYNTVNTREIAVYGERIDQ